MQQNTTLKKNTKGNNWIKKERSRILEWKPRYSEGNTTQNTAEYNSGMKDKKKKGK